MFTKLLRAVHVDELLAGVSSSDSLRSAFCCPDAQRENLNPQYYRRFNGKREPTKSTPTKQKVFLTDLLSE